MSGFDAIAHEQVSLDIFEEMEEQHEQWGEQNHPDGTHPGYAQEANKRKAGNNWCAQHGYLTWAGILLEEVYEAMAETHPGTLREELLQVAAVAGSWAAAIDRREQ